MSHNLKRLLILLLDIVSILTALTLAFLLRFEFALDGETSSLLRSSWVPALLGYMLPFGYFRLYSGIWRYSSFDDLLRIIQATGLGFLLSSITILFIHHGNYPRSVLLLSALLTFLGVCGVRFAIRFSKNLSGSNQRWTTRTTLIIGAGDIGEGLLRQILQTQNGRYKIVGFVDDDSTKWNEHIHGIPILGGIPTLPDMVRKHGIEELLIAVKARRGTVVRAVTDTLTQAGLKAELKIAPSLEETLQNPGQKMTLRDVRPADLLNRPEIKLDEPLIARFISGKTILVTGAGGTIGFELCRQVLHYGPSKLLLLDCHSTSLFYCEKELLAKNKGKPVVPILGNVLDRSLMEKILMDYKPQIVLHAAAHKHLSQLETNVCEAVQNNILATYHLAKAAHRHQVEYFLLVSTDKAVQPTSVMGATKRIAEMVVQGFSQRSKTRFLSVRFGNVLGSSGSVLKIFQEQILRGGPLTLTHPDMTRYFMTVEEAVQLIVQACALAAGGEIFLLKMGEPVRILDMAKNLLLLKGLKLGEDMQIEYTGIRPGEKLYEELMESQEDLADSSHDRIWVLQGQTSNIISYEIIKELQALCQVGAAAELLRRIKDLVPSFQPPGLVRRNPMNSART